jgi:peptide-methionine (R)-S-oxide reductase
MKLDRRAFLGLGGAAMVAGTAAMVAGPGADAQTGRFPFRLSDDEWRRRLNPAQYAVLRRASTERPGSSPLDREHRAGTFACAGCGHPLFSSRTKFESGTGWPSFWRPLPRAIGTREDGSMAMRRTEVHCARCGGHLGHVFPDGPPPTGLRYCMNGAAMAFRAT